jgi:predicted ATP-dependent endonuclease of OLD family
MFISSIKIEGFRLFNNISVDFADGINVIIGHNNAGKTNLLKAISLLVDSDAQKRLIHRKYPFNCKFLRARMRIEVRTIW